VFDTIADLNRGGRTILLVEQNVRAGLAVADVGAVMDAGTVRLVGEGRQLLGDARLAELYLGGAAHG
jgi:branched-chain amino acid transport system ATP-binding protein